MHITISVECLMATDPRFNPLSMVLPHNVKAKLSVEHKQRLSFNFGFHVVGYCEVMHGGLTFLTRPNLVPRPA